MEQHNKNELFFFLPHHNMIGVYISSGGSRISRWGGADPLGGGANLRCIHFSAKTYAKTKEIDPVGGGGHTGGAPWIRQWLGNGVQPELFAPEWIHSWNNSAWTSKLRAVGLEGLSPCPLIWTQAMRPSQISSPSPYLLATRDEVSNYALIN